MKEPENQRGWKAPVAKAGELFSHGFQITVEKRIIIFLGFQIPFQKLSDYFFFCNSQIPDKRLFLFTFKRRV